MSAVTMSLPCHPEDSAGVPIPVVGAAAVGRHGWHTVLCRSVKDSDFSYSSSRAATPSPQVPEAYRGGLSAPPVLHSSRRAPEQECLSSKVFPSLFTVFCSTEDFEMKPVGLGQETIWRGTYLAELRIFPSLGLPYSQTRPFFP